MANKEMYDYLSSYTVDFSSSALNLSPQEVITEEGSKNQEIKYADDGSEERISFSNDSIFYATLRWNNERSTDIGTVLDYYHSTGKGNGAARTFKWNNISDGHTYVVRFDGNINRTIRPAPYSFGLQALPSVRLRVLGTT
ncbi:MAG: hypothetical protein ACE5RH_00445 [Nitrosarchaeum sp.]